MWNSEYSFDPFCFLLWLLLFPSKIGRRLLWLLGFQPRAG